VPISDAYSYNNANLVRSYLWGTDLSGRPQGAGGVGGLLAVNEKTNGVHFVAYDGNGNVVGLVKATDGTLSAKYDYDPFGQTIRASGFLAGVNPYRFSSKYEDKESRCLYYGQRFYSPNNGRWISRDRIDETGGRNLFGYCHQSPGACLNPSGRSLRIRGTCKRFW